MLLASKAALILAAWGAFSQRDIWLAPTQWLLVAILLGVYAIYHRGPK